MIEGTVAVGCIQQLEFTHVVWVPDTFFGCWEKSLEASSIRLIRVCREGEAWPLAAGLYLGGARPLVIMQTTGLFESGDALRNVLFDLRLPIDAWIGVRNWLDPSSTDSARRFTEAIVHAWELPYRWVCSQSDLSALMDHFMEGRVKGQGRVALFAEGKG